MEATSTEAVALESVGFSVVVKVPLNEPKVPLTLLIMRWRTLKPTSLCEGSRAQVPTL
jgi:hypothetical protein